MSHPHNDHLHTYKQFLDAETLARALLMKHAQEASQGEVVLYGEPQIEEAFSRLAAKLGYRIEKIEAVEATAPAVFRDRPGFDAASGRVA